MSHPSRTVNLQLPSRTGIMFVISSPSGTGKTSLTNELFKRDNSLKRSISYTTRLPRPTEREGRDYYFVTNKMFEHHITQEDFFVEYAQVFGNFYGTPKLPLEQKINAGQDILFDVDWKGVQNLSQVFPNDIVRIFLLPPCFKELERRLKERAQDNLDIISHRISCAREELRHWNEFDYVLINDNFKNTLYALGALIETERIKKDKLLTLPTFVKTLLSGVQL